MLLSARWSAQSARAAVSSRTLPRYPISDPEVFAEGQKCHEQGRSGGGSLGLLAPCLINRRQSPHYRYLVSMQSRKGN